MVCQEDALPMSCYIVPTTTTRRWLPKDVTATLGAVMLRIHRVFSLCK